MSDIHQGPTVHVVVYRKCGVCWGLSRPGVRAAPLSQRDQMTPAASAAVWWCVCTGLCREPFDLDGTTAGLSPRKPLLRRTRPAALDDILTFESRLEPVITDGMSKNNKRRNQKKRERERERAGLTGNGKGLLVGIPGSSWLREPLQTSECSGK